MALVYITGFETLAAVQDIGSLMLNNSASILMAGDGTLLGTGRYGGVAVTRNFSQGQITIPVPAQATYIAGVAFCIGNTADSDVVTFGGPGFPHVNLRCSNDGRTYAVYKQPFNIFLGKFVVPGGPSMWHYFEVQTTIHASTGSVTVRANGNTVLSLTGINTFGGGSAQITYLSFLGNSAVYASVDDIYICDTTGSTHNSFLGEFRAVVLRPSGAGNSAANTPVGAANNWTACRDSSGPDGDTSYVQSTAVGDKDSHAIQDLTGSWNVLGVNQVCVAKKTDSGTVQLTPHVRCAGTDYDGAPAIPATDYRRIQTVWPVNPATSALWTTAEINAIESGFRRSS